MWQMRHVKSHFPFAFTPVELQQSVWQRNWWQSLKTTVSPFHLVKRKEPGQRLFTKTTWDGAAEFQALRMINGFANPVGLQTQMRTELIAVRTTLAWMERKCRRATAKKKKKKKGPVAAVNSKLAFAYKSSLGVHKSWTAYSWNCP